MAHGTGRQSGGFWGKRKQKNETAFRTDEFEHARARSTKSPIQIGAPSDMNPYPAVTQISPRVRSKCYVNNVGFCVDPANVIAIRHCTFAGSTQHPTYRIVTPRGDICESRRGLNACQAARRSELQILRYAAARARARPYGEKSRFFLFFSPKNPLTVCLCRVAKIGGLINSSKVRSFLLQQPSVCIYI